MTGTPSSRSCAIKARGIFTTEVEIDERYVGQTPGNKFRGFCRCRRRPGYLRAQELKVLFQGVCHTL